MAGIAHIVMRLLLFSFIRTGINGNDGLILAQQQYDISYPCGQDLICFNIWRFSTSGKRNFIAIVTNNEIERPISQEEDSKCSLPIEDLTVNKIESLRCHQGPDVFSPYSTPSATPTLTLMPGKTVSLQCILLTYTSKRCSSRLQEVSLMWVDEDGAEIQEDSQHQLKQNTCDVTLTVTFKSPADKKFRCQATVNGQVQTSVEVLVRAPALKGKGRGFIIELEPENKVGGQDVVGPIVGVVGCVVLAALVAAFVVYRRRTRNQLPDEPSCNTSSTNNVVNTADVTYADIVLPASSEQAWIHECESTEYACIQYH